MALLIGFAFVSGIVTILSPCVLPALPIILSGTVGTGRGRPFGIVTGFVLGFLVLNLILAALVTAAGLPEDLLRYIAIGVLVAFAIVMIVPWLGHRFEALMVRLTSRGQKMAAVQPSFGKRQPPAKAGSPWRGYGAGIPIGLSLGVIWAPCVGPIMTSVIGLAATQKLDGGAIILALAYSLGTAVPMLGVMVGGQALLNRLPKLARFTPIIQRIFGGLMLLTALAMAFGWDRQFQRALLEAFPSYGSGLTAFEDTTNVRDALDRRQSSNDQLRATAEPVGPNTVFAGVSGSALASPVVTDYGRIPALPTRGTWLNGQTLGSILPTVESLQGKVILVDFWTYSCINCIRTLPYIRAWYETYKDQGLVILAYHTPEFEFEKNAANLKAAMTDLGVTWPVIQDNDRSQWSAYNNRYWPADYIVDAKGRVRYFHFGEGDYANTEHIIRQLLAEAGKTVGPPAVLPKSAAVDSHETYFGYDRGKGYNGTPSLRADKVLAYTDNPNLGTWEWTLAGSWAIDAQFIASQGDSSLSFAFEADKVFAVIEPAGSAQPIQVLVDGQPAPDTEDVRGGFLKVDASRLYKLAQNVQPGRHVITLKVPTGLRLFTFTFG